MLRISVDAVLGVTGGALLRGEPDAFVTGLAVDSRLVTAGSAFVALPGDRTDGHEYLADALDRGARLLIVTRDAGELPDLMPHALRRGASVVQVEEGLAAVQSLAKWYRGKLLCPVVGVTGSTGKTTTKDLLKAALAQEMRVTCTEGNRNNELGVPLTVLSAGSDTDVLVVEMGMRGRGQIAGLCEIARPTLGLVTNVGSSHIEVLGSQDAIADAKGELVEAIPPDGEVFINGDDVNSAPLVERSKAPITRYGMGESCDIRAESVTMDERGMPSFVLESAQGGTQVTLPVPGAHNVYNALAAAAVALRLAVPLEKVAAGLGSARVSEMRMESIDTASGVRVLNDAYNANPSSMKAAVETVAAIHVSGKRVLVLGDMAELGGLTELAHFQLGEHVARSGVEVLVTVGPRARRIAEGARAEGMAEDDVRPCATAEEAIEVLDDTLSAGDVVLVKASRVMGLETVVRELVSPRAR